MILCSTGAFVSRANGNDHRLIAEYESQLDCDGFELMLTSDWTGKLREVSDHLAGKVRKPFVTVHIGKRVGDLISRNEEGDSAAAQELFERSCEAAVNVGAEKLVLHLWNGIYSDRDMPHCVDMYKRLREISERHGLLLTVENVVCNFNDPMTDMHTVLDACPDAVFTFDTKMAEFHGQLMDIALPGNRKLWERVVHLHINDYSGGVKDWSNLKTLHIGDGQIDFDKFFGFAGTTGYKGDLTVESTAIDKEGRPDIPKMNRSLCRVRELCGKYLCR